MQPAGITLRPSLELDGLRMIASLTFDGHGPAILPASGVPSHLRGDFVLLPIESLPPRRVGVALRVRGLPSVPTRAVSDPRWRSNGAPPQQPSATSRSPT